MNARLRFPLTLAGVALIMGSGCVPTISMHSYRDATVTITEADSGKPVAFLPFRVIYSYAPADSPLVYHVELRTPHEVRGKTDGNGKAVIRIADYAWNIALEAEEKDRGDWNTFYLSKDIVRKGGVVEARYRGTKHRKLKLELQPVHPANYTMKRMRASRPHQAQFVSPQRLADRAR